MFFDHCFVSISITSARHQAWFISGNRTLLEEETNEELKTLIKELIERKKQMSEKEEGERIDKLDEYIKDNLSYYKEWLEEQKDDRNPDWKPLNALFLKMLS